MRVAVVTLVFGGIVYLVTFARHQGKFESDLAALRESRDLITTNEVERLLSDASAKVNYEEIERRVDKLVGRREESFIQSINASMVSHEKHNIICGGVQEKIFTRLNHISDTQASNHTEVLAAIEGMRGYQKGKTNGAS